MMAWMFRRKGSDRLFRLIMILMLIVDAQCLNIYCVTGNSIYFYILAVWGAVYGLTTFIVMFFLIRRYHRQLKERFSYQENINLNWLLAILSSCFLILIIWTMSCFVINVDFGDLYMVLSLAIWMFICYFVYKHESVIDELTHATQLLRTSSYTILEVAEKSGFNSVSTFRRFFVAAHECSPNEYRAQM